MASRTRTVVGYALVFAVPVGAGLGVAIEVTGGGPRLALQWGVVVAVVLFLALLALFSSGTVEDRGSP